MARVVLENLTKIFVRPGQPSVTAVDHLNLTLEHNERVVLVGPSGCGKTTTLRMIAGLEPPTEGTLSIDERPMNGVPAKERDIAMVFQDQALYPHLTIYENIGFGLRLRQVPRAEIEKRVSEAARLLDLAGCLARKPDELSGGQRQRAALGRALVRQPKLWLLDEPLSDLDPPLRAQMRAEIAKLHQRLGATMFYVTHDQIEAMSLGDRVAVMKGGVLQQVDSPLNVYQRPVNRFVAGFIGSPPMNFFAAMLKASNDGFIVEEQGDGEKPFCLAIDPSANAALQARAGQKVIFGIRPEHIQPSSEPLPGRSLNALVEWVEHLGAESWLHLRSAAHSFAARSRSANRSLIDRPISVVLDMSQAHFFDPINEQRIG